MTGVIGLEDATARILGWLNGVENVHAPPVPASPVTGLSVLVQTPKLAGVLSFGRDGCPRWAVSYSVLVVSDNTTGSGLLARADLVVQALGRELSVVTTDSYAYQPPGTPAPLPAILISGE